MTGTVTPVPDAAAIAAALCNAVGLEPSARPEIALQGEEGIVPSSFRIAAAASASIGAVAVAAWALRSVQSTRLRVDMRAAVADFASEQLVSVNGGPPPTLWDPLAGAYRCRDDRWVRIHTNFEHHRARLLEWLGCAAERGPLEHALAARDAFEVEAAAAEHGFVAAAVRTFDEWDAHEQAAAIRTEPLVKITRIGEAPPRPVPRGPHHRPLNGLRVLETTRIVAGPVCGRVLASHGAQVLRVLAPGIPTVAALDIDTGRGKRSAWLDIARPEGLDRYRVLASEADVLLQSYRPGVLERFGLEATSLAAARPGLVVAALSAYGERGPWAGRRGFDSLVQSATGFNRAEADAAAVAAPRALPVQALDHASGYLLALGVIAALSRRAREGGSWSVSVSLARTGIWLRSLGRLDTRFDRHLPTPETDADLFETSNGPHGRVRAVRHAATVTGAASCRAAAPRPYGTDEAVWLATRPALHRRRSWAASRER